MENDKYNLQRFVKAQQDSYSKAYMELSQGNKQSHWMWWTFPQIEGLGMTATSHRYAIKSLAEAKAYLEHPYHKPHFPIRFSKETGHSPEIQRRI